MSRQKLFEAAADVFADSGYARANISERSVRAAFGKGTVYNCFRSKHQLLLAVVEQAMGILIEEIREEISDIEDPVAKIKCAIRADFRFMAKNEALSKVIVREGFASDPEKQQEFLAALAGVSAFFVEILEDGKEKGLVRSDLDSAWTTVLANGMVAYMLLVWWGSGNTGTMYDQMAEMKIKCFVEGILAKQDDTSSRQSERSTD